MFISVDMNISRVPFPPPFLSQDYNPHENLEGREFMSVYLPYYYLLPPSYILRVKMSLIKSNKIHLLWFRWQLIVEITQVLKFQNVLSHLIHLNIIHAKLIF